MITPERYRTLDDWKYLAVDRGEILHRIAVQAWEAVHGTNSWDAVPTAMQAVQALIHVYAELKRREEERCK